MSVACVRGGDHLGGSYCAYIVGGMLGGAVFFVQLYFI